MNLKGTVCERAFYLVAPRAHTHLDCDSHCLLIFLRVADRKVPMDWTMGHWVSQYLVAFAMQRLALLAWPNYETRLGEQLAPWAALDSRELLAPWSQELLGCDLLEWLASLA